MANRKKAKVLFIEKTLACLFCKRTTEDEVEFGGLKITKNLRAHYYCLLLSESIGQTGKDNQGILGFLPKDILDELCKSTVKQCCYCNEYGATLACDYKNCNRKFHLPCGLMQSTQHNFNTYTNYCHLHRKPSNVPVHIKRDLSGVRCMICLENFDSIELTNAIWADCCKSDVMLHLRCMKQMALSAGYFTKCPGCNNNRQFIHTIKSFGVFVPERDASWELGENPFSELLYVHSQCDVATCRCPQGRQFCAKSGKWKIQLCCLCGSFGTHSFCSKSRKRITCDACNLKKKNKPSTSTSLASSGSSVSKDSMFEETNGASCSYSNVSQEMVPSSSNFRTSLSFTTDSSNTNNERDSDNEELQKNNMSPVSIKEEHTSNQKESIACKEDNFIDLCSDEEEYVDDKKCINVMSEKDLQLLGQLSSSVKVKHVSTGELVSSPKPSTSKILPECTRCVYPRRVAIKSTTQIARKRTASEIKQHFSDTEEEESPVKKSSKKSNNHPPELNKDGLPALKRSDKDTDLNMNVDDKSSLVVVNGNKCTYRLNTLINKVENIVANHHHVPNTGNKKEMVGVIPLEEKPSSWFQQPTPVLHENTNSYLFGNNTSNELCLAADQEIEFVTIQGEPPLLSKIKKEDPEEVITVEDSDNDGDWLSNITITNIRTVTEEEIPGTFGINSNRSTEPGNDPNLDQGLS